MQFRWICLFTLNSTTRWRKGTQFGWICLFTLDSTTRWSKSTIQMDLFVYTRFYYTVEEEHAIQMDLFVYISFYYTVEEERAIQTDLFVYTRFYYTVEEEHTIQMDLFVYTRFHSRNIYCIPSDSQWTSLQIFGRHESFLWGHWYPYFGLLVTSPLGFKARVGSALFELSRGMHVTLQIPSDSHLVRHTLTSRCGQHGGWAVSSTYLQGIGGTRNREPFVFMVKGFSLPHSDLLCERPRWPSNTDIRNL